MEHELEVMIWGTRGSLAAPYANRMRFGGNSSCVSVRWGENIVVFDCGTGLQALGDVLVKEGKMYVAGDKVDRNQSFVAGDGMDKKDASRVDRNQMEARDIHIFLSHLHLDHICALPFFPILFQKNWNVHLYGQPLEGETFKGTVGRVIAPPFWPITLEQTAATIIWHDLCADQCIQLPDGVVVKTFQANHGPGALLYRMERGDRSSFVYGLDHELTGDNRTDFCKFVHGASLLLFDGMYTDEEYVRCKGFGHSVWMQGIDLAQECDIGTVCISHHAWNRTDEQLEEMEKMAQEIQKHCVFAREGMRVCLK